jgi:hypothetical protein
MSTLKKIFPLPFTDEILTNPKEGNLKNSLNNLGYGSSYMSNNLGSFFEMVLGTMITLVV